MSDRPIIVEGPFDTVRDAADFIELEVAWLADARIEETPEGYDVRIYEPEHDTNDDPRVSLDILDALTVAEREGQYSYPEHHALLDAIRDRFLGVAR